MLIDRQNRFRLLAVIVLMGGMMSAAHADDDDDHERHERNEMHSGKYGGENRGKPVQPSQLNATFQKECSSCHIAYAPGLLPAESWRKIMGGLDKHFGADASLTDQENKEITAFLVKNASNRWSAPTAPLRITETTWFRSRHDSHEISPAVWKRPGVRSPANCAACHPLADRGDFEEDNIRIPK